jgi:hypothetical protein
LDCLEWLETRRVKFGMTGIMEWLGIGGSRVRPDWNGLDYTKLVLASLKWHGLAEVGFRLPAMAWNRRSLVWPGWNGLEWGKLVLA